MKNENEHNYKLSNEVAYKHHVAENEIEKLRTKCINI